MKAHGLSLKRSTLFVQGGYQFYFFLLLWVYVKYIPYYFGYEGYEDEFDSFRTIVSVPIIFLLVRLTSSGGGVTSFFLHLGMMFLMIPSTVLFCAGGKTPYFYIVSLAGYLLMAFAGKLMRPRVFSFPGVSRRLLLSGCVIVCIVTIGMMFLFGGFRFFNLDFSTVYEFRQDAEDNLPGFFGYLVPAVTKIFIPIGVLISIERRAWPYLFFLLLSSVLIFGLTSHKAILFYPLIVAGIYFLYGYRGAIFYLLIGLSFLVLACGASFSSGSTGGDIYFGSLLLRRALLVPAQLNSLYIDWFDKNPFVFWAESKFTFGLLSSPYDLRVVNVIGAEYFNSSDLGANTGWIGSGYANAGIWGVIFYSLGIGALLSFLSAYAKKLDGRFVVAAFSPVVIVVFQSSDFLTSLFTHGLFAALAILVLISPPGEEDRRSGKGFIAS